MGLVCNFKDLIDATIPLVVYSIGVDSIVVYIKAGTSDSSVGTPTLLCRKSWVR